MVYQFTSPKPSTIPNDPNYEVDFDGENITVTHFKTGALFSHFSLPQLKAECKGPFEVLAQYILREISGAKGKDATSDLAAHANSPAVVRFTEQAMSQLNAIAIHNKNMAPLYQGGKF